MNNEFVFEQVSGEELDAISGGALPALIVLFSLFAGGGYKVGTDRAKRDNCVHNGKC